jgi:hypothetical protein
MYDKPDWVLRVDTVINQPREFKDRRVPSPRRKIQLNTSLVGVDRSITVPVLKPRTGFAAAYRYRLAIAGSRLSTGSTEKNLTSAGE